MNTVEEIREAFARLTSKEGTIQFLSQQTLLSPERVKRIHQFGDPWPLPESVSSAPEWEYIDAARRGETHSQDGVEISTTLNALAQLREMDNEDNEKNHELEPSPAVDDHLKEVAFLSGESPEAIRDVYRAIIRMLLTLVELVQQLCQLKEKETNG